MVGVQDLFETHINVVCGLALGWDGIDFFSTFNLMLALAISSGFGRTIGMEINL